MHGVVTQVDKLVSHHSYIIKTHNGSVTITETSTNMLQTFMEGSIEQNFPEQHDIGGDINKS